MTLMSKRKLEKKPRTWVVWIFDVSKQVVGGTLIQLVNLGISIFIFNNYNNKHIMEFYQFFYRQYFGSNYSISISSSSIQIMYLLLWKVHLVLKSVIMENLQITKFGFNS